MYTIQLRKWLAAALLAFFALALVWGMWSLQSQQHLAEEVIRLHVIADSDSAEDQRLKLRVRDAVLEQAEQWLQGVEDRDAAEEILRTRLMDLRDLAAEVVRSAGYAYEVDAWLTPETYPTRDYGAFSLPGGEYLSLRIVIGEGEGHNWWCVVYPPLCTAAATGELEEKASAAGLSKADIGLITRDGEGCTVRFKSIELWEKRVGKWSRGPAQT